jgi:hypothetical protein
MYNPAKLLYSDKRILKMKERRDMGVLTAMKTHKNKKAYIVATIFGLSLIIVIPSVSLARNIHNKHIGLMMSGTQIGLLKSHMMQNRMMQNGTHFGVVASVSGSTFVLDSKMKQATTTFTVNTDTNTAFKKDGVVDTLSDLSVGQHVVVRGSTDISTGTILAKSVNIITHEPTKTGLEHVFKKQK